MNRILEFLRCFISNAIGNFVASELKDPICHSNECQIGSFSSEATICSANATRVLNPYSAEIFYLFIYIFIYINSLRQSTSDVRILTSKIGPRAERVTHKHVKCL